MNSCAKESGYIISNQYSDADESEQAGDIEAMSNHRVIDTGSIIADDGRYVIQFMTIIGQIEGHYILSPRNKTTKYEHIIPQLIAAEQSTEIQGLLVMLNTAGGDARSATMTIHPVRMNGMMLGVPQAFEYFKRMQSRITDFVTTHSKISAERYNSLALNTGELVMDAGTILDGPAAVSEGLINSVGSLSDAVRALHKMIDRQCPAAGDK